MSIFCYICDQIHISGIFTHFSISILENPHTLMLQITTIEQINTIIGVFTLDLYPQGSIFFHVTKCECTWHENIPRIFVDVPWNMFQRFFLVPLSSSLVHCSLARCSPTNVTVQCFHHSFSLIKFKYIDLNDFFLNYML